ncbi:hypothetical protein [Aeromonas molluscorum]|jgi:hypothetical protein|uniref:Uncharacterized protein n=1 Tax=Aeromonas molluscorum 848 TaxID=1268236 RepID=R1F126_9GAMM|nr:hypothetical protein [Aeromonas molluscorum]EOD53693.1 hypothetical protein G113_18264 [Aeromonas molluscorum 848]
MKDHLVEIRSPVLFEEYLQSMGLPRACLEQEQEIYRQDRHLAAVRLIQGEMRFYLKAAELGKR